jgi:hypothetical protein
MTRSLVLALLLAPAAAVAQPSATPADDKADEPEDKPIKPDKRAVAEAREANLEPESQRSGLAVGFAFGPNLQISSGLRDASGTGGGLAIRFGTVASPRWVWLAELASTGYQQHDDATNSNKINSSTLFTLGGQLYAKDAFWFRGGGGPANFTRRTDRGGDPSASFWGFGFIGAGGLDIVRRHSLAISLEVLTTLARYRDGFVGAGSMQLGFSWY